MAAARATCVQNLGQRWTVSSQANPLFAVCLRYSVNINHPGRNGISPRIQFLLWVMFHHFIVGMVQFHTKYFKILQQAYTLSQSLPPTTPNESKTSTSFLCLSRYQLHAQRRSASQTIDPEWNTARNAVSFWFREIAKSKATKQWHDILPTSLVPFPKFKLFWPSFP